MVLLLLPLLGSFGAKQMVEDGITTEDAAHAAWKREHAANVDHFQWLELPEYAAGKAVAFSYGSPAPSTKLAVFDFDGTLINPLACMGQYCPDPVWAGYREWTHTFADVVRPKLAGLVADGFKIVIVSNQGPFKYATERRPELVGRDVAPKLPLEKEGVWVSKATEFAQLINTGAEGAEVPIPLHVFALKGSVDGEGFYKPCADWWALYMDDFNGDIRQVDCTQTVFVGDAGGRLRGDTTNPWQNGTDQWEGYAGYAASDRQFALSGGVVYSTPEEVFAGAAPPAPGDYHQPSFEGEWCGREAEKRWCLP